MNTSLYLLIAIGIIDGFFMRPLHQLVMARGIKLIKFVNQRSLAIALLISSMLAGMVVTLSAIYFSLRLSGYVPLDKEQLAYFIVSFLVGSVCWIFYARHFNRSCPLDLDADLKRWQ